MPAPGKRNKGESLAVKVGNASRIESLADSRDRQAAHRSRHAMRWEEAASRLPTSDLAERADQARADHARAKHLSRFSIDVKAGKAQPPVILTEGGGLVLVPRYSLDCLDCNQTMPLFRREPRVPLCQSCTASREHRRAEKRASIRAKRQVRR